MVVMKNYLCWYSWWWSRWYWKWVGGVSGGGEVKFLVVGSWIWELEDNEGLDFF